MAPTKCLSTSSSFYCTFFAQKSTALWPIFPQLFHSLLKRGFLAVLFLFLLLFLLLFTQHFDALWPYFPHLLHSPLKNLILLFLRLFPRRSTLEPSILIHIFPLIFFRPAVFQEKRISLFKYLNFIFAMLTLQDTLTGLYSAGKTSNTCALSFSSYFHIFP